MISLSSITIPTPEPYDSNHPNQQRETYYYVRNQILAAAKAASDQDPFGLLDAITASGAVVNVAPAVSVDVDDVSIKLYGEAVLIEGF